MARSKLANAGKGQRIKRDRSGAVMLSSDDISVSLQTLVRTRHLTQAEAEALWLALGPSSNRQSILNVMQTVSTKSSPLMQFLRNSTIGAASPDGSTDAEPESEASTGSSVGGALGAIGGAMIGAYLGGVAGAALGATVGKAVGEAAGAVAEDALSGDGDSGGDDPGGDSGGGGDPGGAGARRGDTGERLVQTL
jgi:hypothetical protein